MRVAARVGQGPEGTVAWRVSSRTGFLGSTSCFKELRAEQVDETKTLHWTSDGPVCGLAVPFPRRRKGRWSGFRRGLENWRQQV